MARKSHESSQQEKLVSVRAEDIFNKPLTAGQKAELERLKDMPDSEIDFSDIPELTEEQLSEFRSPARQYVGVQLDRDVMDWLKKSGGDYSARINEILRRAMTATR